MTPSPPTPRIRYCISATNTKKKCLVWILPELGSGWSPARINSAAELEFVLSEVKDLADMEDFYIGGRGHRDTGDEGILDFSEYTPSYYGKTENTF